MKTLFWILAILIFYTYFGYPLVLAILGLFLSKKREKGKVFPFISVIIAAYNEEKNIRKKIDETLTLEYPKDRFEIIVASDGSTDTTDDIVRSFRRGNVILLLVPGRKGKTHAQNEAVKIAKGEILVFSDATTIYKSDVLQQIANNFVSANVGGVGAELLYVDKTSSQAEAGGGLYWKYEKYLKRKESDLTSLIGVSGCCYALRKELYEEIDPAVISDFVVAQKIYKKGKMVVFEPQAVVYEELNRDLNDEFRMRVRVATRSLYGLWHMKEMLNPFRYGLYALQLISHKVLRYLVPLFGVSLFLVNIFLLRESVIYLLLFFSQVLFYLSALLGMFLQKKKTVFTMFSYFCIMNVALLIALLNFFKGEKNVVWNPLR